MSATVLGLSAAREQPTPDALRTMIAEGASNESVLRNAWLMVQGTVPREIADRLPRGGFLDAALELAEANLGPRLVGWTIEYTTAGGPYSAELHIDRIGGGCRATCALSSAAAVVLALLDWHDRPRQTETQ
jgi:hypothetical protein